MIGNNIKRDRVAKQGQTMNVTLLDFGFKVPVPDTRYYCTKCRMYLVLDKSKPITECPICERKMINLNTAITISTFRKSTTYHNMKLQIFTNHFYGKSEVLK